MHSLAFAFYTSLLYSRLASWSSKWDRNALDKNIERENLRIVVYSTGFLGSRGVRRNQPSYSKSKIDNLLLDFTSLDKGKSGRNPTTSAQYTSRKR